MVAGDSQSKCHGEVVYDYIRGIIICSDTAEVLGEIVDTGPEWRAFSYEEYMSRARGSEIFAPGVEPPSTLVHRPTWFKDVREKLIAARLNRLIRRHNRSDSRNPERLISAYAAKLSLPRHVVEDALNIYRKLKSLSLCRGSVRNSAVAAACLYAACRMNSIPRTIKEFTETLGVPRKDLSNWYRVIAYEVGIRANHSVEQYIKRISSALNMRSSTVEKALEIYRAVMEANIGSGKNPVGLAAAIIYIAGIISGDRRTMKEITTVTGVTEVTMRKRIREIVSALKIKL